MDEKSIQIIEEPKAVQPVSEKTLTDYLQAFGLSSQLTKAETMQFIEVSKAFALNPFKREIYCIPYQGKDGKRSLSIITGYETYLKRAEYTGKLDGWECAIEGQGPNMKAIVTIFKKGWSRPFKHEVYFSEYNTGKSLWISKPRTMLKKVAVAQAFRLCFPDDMGGMPYTDDELPEEMTAAEPRDVTPPAETNPVEAARAAEAAVLEEIIAEIKDLNRQIAEVKAFIPGSMLADLRKELKNLGDDANEANRVKNMCADALSFGLEEKRKQEGAQLPKCAQPIEPQLDAPVFHLEGFPDEEDFADDSAELYEENK